MVNNTPTILIYVMKPDDELLKEICAGIEEEGVLYDIVKKDIMDVSNLSYSSANDSILGTGIGMYKTKVCVLARSLSKEKPIISIEAPSNNQARDIGANAARLVKRKPLKKFGYELQKE